MKIIEYGHPIDGIPYPVEIRTKTTTAATWSALSASMPYLFHTPT